MKVIQILALLTASSVASPVPVAQYDTDIALTDRSVNEQVETLAILEKRINVQTCKPTVKTVYGWGSTAGTVIFVNGVSSLARRVCQEQGYDKCAQYVSYIQDAYNLIFGLRSFSNGAVAQAAGSGEAASTNNGIEVDNGGAVRRSAPAKVDYNGLGDALKAHGYTFESHDVVPAKDLAGQQPAAGSQDPKLLHRSTINGLAHEKASAPYDITVSYYDNGHVNMNHAAAASQQNGKTTRRYDAPKGGFKFAWTSRAGSPLTSAHENDMSAALAKDWADYADNKGIDEYIGFVETGHTANFYFRIIPELQGFGLNYEDVNVCGGMGRYL